MQNEDKRPHGCASAGACAMNMEFVCEVFVWGDGVRIGLGVDRSREGKGEGALIFWPRGGGDVGQVRVRVRAWTREDLVFSKF